MLAGVAATKLTPAQRDDLQQKLEALLPRLGKLVTAKINWRSEGKHLLVKREELAQWAEELALPEDWVFKPFWLRWWDGVMNFSKRLRQRRV